MNKYTAICLIGDDHIIIGDKVGNVEIWSMHEFKDKKEAELFRKIGSFNKKIISIKFTNGQILVMTDNNIVYHWYYKDVLLLDLTPNYSKKITCNEYDDDDEYEEVRLGYDIGFLGGIPVVIKFISSLGVEIIDLETDEIIREVSFHEYDMENENFERDLETICLSNDGNYLITDYEVWNINNNTCIYNSIERYEPDYDDEIYTNGNEFYSAFDDKKFAVIEYTFDINESKENYIFISIFELDFEYLEDNYNIMNTTDLASNNTIINFQMKEKECKKFTISDNFFATLTKKGYVKLFNIYTKEKVFTLKPLVSNEFGEF
ncbi:hypothetical protein ACN9JU_01935 [Aliarcobacter butzleri]|uniref:hypothetical protein n=1 Tax=Aliarcobacter butzleri TaxID=28197 RepID=UPI003B2164BD